MKWLDLAQLVASGQVSPRERREDVLLSIALANIYRRRKLMQLCEGRQLSSITDLLTGMHNRCGLLEKVEPIWSELISKRIAFVCIDMGHLKRINDAYGHAAGDCAIRLVGQAIREALPEGAIGSRIGITVKKAQ